MKAQVISTRYPQIDANGDRHRRERGETIDVSKEEFARGVELGALREPSDSELPETNAAAAPAPLTRPDGEPIENAETAEPTSEFRKARSHAEADSMASDLGVSFAEDTKLDAKNEALEQVVNARAAGEATPATEDLSELSDKDLIQRGIDFGLTEDDLVELGHDELVLRVAEAMALQGDTEAAQRASVAERTANEGE